MKFIASIFSVIFLTVMALGGELHDVKMSDSEKVNGKDLILNGMGLRDVSIMGVYIHVYVGGLYLEKKSKDGDEILKSSSLKEVKMHFLSKISANDIKKSYQKGFDDNCGSACASMKDKIEAFKALMTEVKEGEEMSLVFSAKGIEASLSGKKLGAVDGADFARIILCNWVGPKPVTSDLKRGLLTNEN